MATKKQYTVVTNFISKGAGEVAGFLQYLEELDKKGLNIDFSSLTQQLDNINAIFNNITKKKLTGAEANQQIKSLYNDLIKNSSSITKDTFNQQNQNLEQLQKQTEKLNGNLKKYNKKLEESAKSIENITNETFSNFSLAKRKDSPIQNFSDLANYVNNRAVKSNVIQKANKNFATEKDLLTWYGKMKSLRKQAGGEFPLEADDKVYKKVSDAVIKYQEEVHGYRVNRQGETVVRKDDYARTERLAAAIQNQEKVKADIENTKKELQNIEQNKTELNNNTIQLQ